MDWLWWMPGLIWWPVECVDLDTPEGTIVGWHCPSDELPAWGPIF